MSILDDGGAKRDEVADKWDHWHALPPTDRNRNQARFRDVLRHLGAQWSYARERPRIVWRTLHQVKTLRWHPQVWHRGLDAIGRAVVAQLVQESEQIERGEVAWRRWVEESGEEGGEWEVREWEEGARRMALGRRLKGQSGTTRVLVVEKSLLTERRLPAVDEWGELMQAQMNHLKVSPVGPRVRKSHGACSRATADLS